MLKNHIHERNIPIDRWNETISSQKRIDRERIKNVEKHHEKKYTHETKKSKAREGNEKYQK